MAFDWASSIVPSIIFGPLGGLLAGFLEGGYKENGGTDTAYNPSTTGSLLGDAGQDLSDIIGGKYAERAFNSAMQEDSQQFTAAENLLSRQFSSAEAQKERDWQEYMSNTAIQRQMKDAAAAGVNPYYLFQSAGTTGASSYQGSTAAASSNSAASATKQTSNTSASAVAALFGAIAKIIAG